MENNIRFRNHISIIFEQMGSVIIFLLIMAGTGFIQNFQEIKKKKSGLNRIDFQRHTTSDSDLSRCSRVTYFHHHLAACCLVKNLYFDSEQHAYIRTKYLEQKETYHRNPEYFQCKYRAEPV